MTQSNSQRSTDGVEASDRTTESDGDEEFVAADACGPYGSESVDADDEDDVVASDRYRCQICGRRGPERGGLATLHVHHIEREPDGIDEDAPANLTTLCRSCHNWVHQRSTPSDAPVTLSEADLSVLLPQDIEILRYLADEGPAKTGEIRDALTADLSVTAVRERLAVLMGLDIQVESRDRQIVDQDVESGAWGLVEQIEHSARGHIPSDPQALVQRVEDEQVRQALERGCDRDAIMSVLDISRRTTFHKEKRACAYDFPLAAFRRGGDGGQHPAGSAADETSNESESNRSGAGTDEQQQLDTVGVTAEDESQGESVDLEGSARQGHVNTAGETPRDRDGSEIREQLETAIAALQRLNAEL